MQRRELLGVAMAIPFAGLSLDGAAPQGRGWKALFDGKSLSGWRSDEADQKWTVADGDLYNGDAGKANNIVTDASFGDVELYLEFQIPAKSNSGVYLHGLYEVQVFDSFGKEQLATTDSGSIYQRWENEKGSGGTVAKVNASRRPGEWQDFHIRFRAPRFDGAGKKAAHARFDWVRYNGIVVQENAECEGPTRSHMQLAEGKTNPIMLQGDHGPVRYRNIWLRAI